MRDYVNIDVSMDSTADLVSDAHNLPVRSSSVEGITATQLIEHLGYFKTRYFLSECFRVLKPGSHVCIETPDLERTAILFVKGDRKTRERTLTWLYGAETEGMGHRLCFPSDLLSALAGDTGFHVAEKSSFLYESRRPSLRLDLVKPQDCVKHDFAAEVRKRLLMRSIPVFDDEIVAAEQEGLLARLTGGKTRGYRQILYLAVQSAPIVREYLVERAVQDGRAVPFLDVACFLADHGFQEYMLGRLMDDVSPEDAQDHAFRRTVDHGRSIIDALLKGERVDLKEAKGRPLAVFGRNAVKALASKIFALGLKEFHRARYEEALALLEESSRIDRDNFFVFWNMARIYRMLNVRHKVIESYERTVLALSAATVATGRKYVGKVKDEVDEFLGGGSDEKGPRRQGPAGVSPVHPGSGDGDVIDR